MREFLIQFAILLGSASDGFRQKNVIKKYNFLTNKKGGFLDDKNIIIFPNGISELFLETVLNRVLENLCCNETQEDKQEDFRKYEENCGKQVSEKCEEKVSKKHEENCGGKIEVLLYVCTKSEGDLNAYSEYEVVGFGKNEQVSLDQKIVVRLENEEIRKELIDYYEFLAEQMGARLCVEYDWDSDFVSEECFYSEVDDYLRVLCAGCEENACLERVKNG